MASIAVLSRLLSKSDYGLIAVVQALTVFASVFTDAGLNLSTIQHSRLTRELASNLFWLGLLLGLACFLLFSALAPLLAWIYTEPRYYLLVPASALVFIITALGNQPVAVLHRKMRFSEVTIVQISSSLVATVVAVYVAYRWRSYWALVAGPLTGSTVRTLVAFWRSGWLPGLPVRNQGTRQMVTFGLGVTAVTLLDKLARTIDQLLIGYFFGLESVGVYSRSFTLATLAMDQVSNPARLVAIPTLSRLRNDPPQYRAFFFKMARIVLLFSIPAVMLVSFASGAVVRVALGREWSEVSPLLKVMVLGALGQVVFAYIGDWLYLSQGRARDRIRWSLVAGLVQAVAIAVGLTNGPLAVAYALTLAWLVLLIPGLFAQLGQRGPITAFDLWLLVLHFAPLAALTAISLAGTLGWVATSPAWVQLAVAGGCLVLSGLVFALLSRSGNEAMQDVLGAFWSVIAR